MIVLAMEMTICYALSDYFNLKVSDLGVRAFQFTCV
jgi:hypothetical protein